MYTVAFLKCNGTFRETLGEAMDLIARADQILKRGLQTTQVLS